MNKYFIIGGIIVLILIAGVVYRLFLLPEGLRPVTTGVVREITVTTGVDQWNFFPETIEVDQGDKIIMTLINEDSYDHGIGIDAFGVSQRMPANSTITLDFVVTQAGDFPFFCSVPCGQGQVDGVERSHFDMIGKLHVRSIITETQ
ncbi:cupredoxin domain-containing protein [Patescibacteria group bacterium]|nr:cupredoxin domain-containing protein [Patescibacteria group bacterium]